jgi:predicted TPR repeat methyltransferase
VSKAVAVVPAHAAVPVRAASQAPVRPPYSALADVYDEIMQDVPYDAWCGFVRGELGRRGWTGRRVLDLGCGTGRAGEPYRDDGFEVVGVDPSEAMIRAARRRDPQGRYLVGDARTLALGERFDLVIAVFDALNNLTGDGELGRACERVAAHLGPGGAFAFDVNTAVGLRSLWEDDVAEGWAGDVYYRWEHTGTRPADVRASPRTAGGRAAPSSSTTKSDPSSPTNSRRRCAARASPPST